MEVDGTVTDILLLLHHHTGCSNGVGVVVGNTTGKHVAWMRRGEDNLKMKK